MTTANAKRWKRHENSAWRRGQGRRVTTRRRLLSRTLLLLLLVVIGGSAGWCLLVRGGNGLPSVLGVMAGREGPSYQTSIPDIGRPLTVATSPDGRFIYAGESGGRRAVRIFDRQGRDVGSIQAPESAEGWLPLDIAVARDGEVYVVDGLWGGIHVFSAEGEFLRSLPAPDGLDRWAPSALAFDDVGNLYVTERHESVRESRHRVLVFSPEGELLREFGKKGSGLGDMNYPSSIAVDRDGRVYVNNMLSGVDVFTSAGVFITRLGVPEGDGGVGLARGLAFDQAGRLYVVDVTGQRVAIYDTDSDGFPFLRSFGSYGFNGGEFRFPAGVTVDVTGRIYVADRENDRVEIWS
jgi:DNA-binding beta-propeller fold protein YncE